MQAAEIEIANSKKIQEKVWKEAEAATRLPDSHPSAGLLLLPALNNMIDIAATRTMALQFTLRGSSMLCCSDLALSVHCRLDFGCRAPIPELAPYPRLHSPHGNHRQ